MKAQSETSADLGRAPSTRLFWLVLVLIAALVFSAFDRHGLAVSASGGDLPKVVATCHDHGMPCPEADANHGHTNPAGQHSPIVCGLALCGSGCIFADAVALAALTETQASCALPGSIILAGQEPEPGRRPPINS